MCIPCRRSLWERLECTCGTALRIFATHKTSSNRSHQVRRQTNFPSTLQPWWATLLPTAKSVEIRYQEWLLPNISESGWDQQLQLSVQHPFTHRMGSIGNYWITNSLNITNIIKKQHCAGPSLKTRNTTAHVEWTISGLLACCHSGMWYAAWLGREALCHSHAKCCLVTRMLCAA